MWIKKLKEGHEYNVEVKVTVRSHKTGIEDGKAKKGALKFIAYKVQ